MPVCPTCRGENPPLSRSCARCGQPLPGGTRPGSAAPEEGLGHTRVGPPPVFEAEAPAPPGAATERAQPSFVLRGDSESPAGRRFDPGAFGPGAPTWIGHESPPEAEEPPSDESPPGELSRAPPGALRITSASREAGPADRNESEAPTDRSLTSREDATWMRVRGSSRPNAPRPVRVKTAGRAAPPVRLFGLDFPSWMLWVAIALAALVGALIAVALPKPPSVRVVGFEVTPDGKDHLTLSCAHCPDGSSLALGAVNGRVQGGIAELTTPSLELGSNHLELEYTARSGKRALIDVTVALAYRVTTDLRGFAEVPPFGIVVVTAPRGTNVSVAGTTVRAGTGIVRTRVELGDLATGELGRVTDIERSVTVRVVGPNLERTSQAVLGGTVVPLLLDPRGPTRAGEPAIVSGTTLADASVRVLRAGRLLGSARSDARGRFEIHAESLRHTRAEPAALTVAAALPGYVSRQVQIPLLPATP